MQEEQKQINAQDYVISMLLPLQHQKLPIKKAQIPVNIILKLIHQAKSIILEQPMLLELYPPLNICGDIHGQFYDLLRIFQHTGFPPHKNYLFLGDYVDRGNHSIQTICLLMAYKVKYPQNFFILRGNHQCASINKIYAYNYKVKEDILLSYGRSSVIYSIIYPLLPSLPIKYYVCMEDSLLNQAHLILYCKFKDLFKFPKLDYYVICSGRILTKILRAGVQTKGGFLLYLVRRQKLKLQLIIRAHQVVQRGYQFFANKKMITIFSAANYCGQFQNSCGILLINEQLVCSLQILKPCKSKKESIYKQSVLQRI